MVSTITDAAAFEAYARQLFDDAPGWLAKARGNGTFADLFAEHSQHTWHHRKVRTGRRTKTESRTETVEGVSLRAVNEDGTAAFAHVTPDAASTLPTQLRRSGSEMQSPVVLSPPVGSLVLPPDAPDGIRETEKQQWLEQLVETVFALDDTVVAVDVQLHDAVRRIALATTTGFAGLNATQRIRLRLAVDIQATGGEATGYVVDHTDEGYHAWFATNPRHWAERAIERAQRRAIARQVHGTFPVVLAEGAAATWVHEAFGHALEADVAEQRGLLAARGTRLTDVPLMLVDKPSLFDDEGTVAAPCTLLHDGMLQHVLADRAQTLRLNVPNTGHARRQDVRHAPLARLHHLNLAPGTATLDALLTEVRDGLLVIQVATGSMRPADDSYQLRVISGWRIENGRPTYPVADIVLSGQLSDAFQAIRGLGNDETVATETGLCEKYGQVVPVTTTAPALLVHGLTCV